MTYSSAIFPDLDSDLKSGGARHQWSGIRGSKNRRMKVVNGYTDPDGCGAANGRFTQNNTTNERACNDATNEYVSAGTASTTPTNHFPQKYRGRRALRGSNVQIRPHH